MITPVSTLNNNYLYKMRPVSKPASQTALIQANTNDYEKDISFKGFLGIKKITPVKHQEPIDQVWTYLLDKSYNKENARKFSQLLNQIKDVDIDKPSGKYGKELRQAFGWLSPDKSCGKDSRLFSLHLILQHLDKFSPGILDSLSCWSARAFLQDDELEKLGSFIKKWENETYPSDGKVFSEDIAFRFYNNALEFKNIGLLKLLMEDLKIKPYTHYNGYNRANCEMSILQKGRSHSDKEISALFDDKHLYEIAKKFLNDSVHYCDSSNFKEKKLLARAYYNEEKNEFKKNDFLNSFLASAYLGKDIMNDVASEFPMAPFERRSVNYDYDSIFPHLNVSVSYFNNLRIDNIIKRNGGCLGLAKPECLLKCLNDTNMSPELLTKVYIDNTSLLANIASVPVNSENSEVMSEIVQKIKDMKYFSYCELSAKGPEVYNNICLSAELAAKNNNVELLKLFKSLHINLNACLAANNFSPEILDVLKDVKPQSSNIVNFASDKSSECLKLYLKQNPNIDINSRNECGETLLLEAVKNGNINILKALKNVEDVDWNITDSTGKNAAMYAIDLYLKSPEKSKEILDLLKSLPEGQFDINYINYCILENTKMPVNALSYSLMNEGQSLNNILDFPGLDVNQHVKNSYPPLFIPAIKYHADINSFKKLLTHSDIDLQKSFEAQTLPEYIAGSRHDYSVDDILNVLQKEIDKKLYAASINLMTDIYDKEGTFTLEQIKDFVNLENFSDLKNIPLNSLGERIGHFLPEITNCEKNYENLKDLNDIFNTLAEKGYDINILDDFGRSMLRKAVEAENMPVVRILSEFGSHPDDMNEVKELALQSNNEELINIINNL